MKNKTIYFLFACFASLFIFSCGPSAQEKEMGHQMASDSLKVQEQARIDSSFSIGAPVPDEPVPVPLPPPDPDTIIPQHELMPRTTDSVAAANVPTAPNEHADKGSIAFYCPKKMIESTATNVSVIISKNDLAKVKQLLENKIAAITNKNEKEINQGIEVHPIDIYSKMKVELKYSDGDIEVISKPETEALLFNNTIKEQEWDWVVKPKKLGSLQLILAVSAFNEVNNEWIAVETPPRIFNIVVKVDPRNYFTKLWLFLEDHPEWIFMQVLFPVIAFFVGKKRGKKATGNE